jgi:hypothetical protein
VRASNVSSASFILHHSLLKLPGKPLQPRLADPRVGFITGWRSEFSVETARAPICEYICRKRLEKRTRPHPRARL